MNNKAKKTVLILFGSLIAAAVLPLGVAGMADAAADREQTKEGFKSDVKQWLQSLDADKQSRAEKAEELKRDYNEFLLDTIEHVRVLTGTVDLTLEEKKAAMQYIVDETIKDERFKLATDGDSGGDRLDSEFLDLLGIQTAQATCPATTNPTYRQLAIDIDGGTYGGHAFNGDNGLYLVLYEDDPGSCERTFTLSFYDEDHPTLDALYDGLRFFLYNRVFDIESFVIRNNSQIIFDNSWSSGNQYACLDGAEGCHDSGTLSYTPGQMVYVSNTWNHMMSTSDTNPSLTKVSVP